jgi:hypothetical protein
MLSTNISKGGALLGVVISSRTQKSLAKSKKGTHLAGLWMCPTHVVTM